MIASLIIALLTAAAPAADQRQAVASADVDVAERSADPRTKMICKRFMETGSLVRGYRTCKTKTEWDRERENIRTLSVADSCRQRAEGGGC